MDNELLKYYFITQKYQRDLSHFKAQLDQEPERPTETSGAAFQTKTKDHMRSAGERYGNLRENGQLLWSKLNTARDRQREYMDTLAKLQVSMYLKIFRLYAVVSGISE